MIFAVFFFYNFFISNDRQFCKYSNSFTERASVFSKLKVLASF